MVSSIRLILLIVGAVIILTILFDGLRRKKKKYTKLSLDAAMNQKNLYQKVFHEDILGIQMPVEEAGVQTSDQPQEERVFQPSAEISEEVFLNEQVEESNQRFISIRVLPQEENQFGGYPLLRAILANDLHYGEKKLFHRYLNSVSKQKKLFSLASLNDPGDFDLGQMRNYRCDGLIFYMNAEEHENSLFIFEEMLRTAQALARAVHGILMASKKQPWTVEATEKIRAELT